MSTTPEPEELEIERILRPIVSTMREWPYCTAHGRPKEIELTMVQLLQPGTHVRVPFACLHEHRTTMDFEVTPAQAESIQLALTPDDDPLPLPERKPDYRCFCGAMMLRGGEMSLVGVYGSFTIRHSGAGCSPI